MASVPAWAFTIKGVSTPVIQAALPPGSYVTPYTYGTPTENVRPLGTAFVGGDLVWPQPRELHRRGERELRAKQWGVGQAGAVDIGDLQLRPRLEHALAVRGQLVCGPELLAVDDRRGAAH